MDEVASARQKLLQGAFTFTSEVFPKKKEVYERVMQTAQAPHSLFITCSDSRIEPAAITQSQPGEVFVSRNIGNLVPPHGEMLGSMSAVIEYAVVALGVKQIVVCGHSGCGAMKALMDPTQVDKLPAIRSWLRHAEAALDGTEAEISHGPHSPESPLNSLIERNVLLQLDHLRSYPCIAERLAQGKLGLSGWVYDIARGAVSAYNDATSNFETVTTSLEAICGG